MVHHRYDIFKTYLRKHLLKSLANPITDLSSPSITLQILGSNTIIQHLLDCLLDESRFFPAPERVSEHHGCREDGADGVGDALTGDIGSGACDVSVISTQQ